MNELFQFKYIMASVVYSFIGIFILIISFVIIEKITPQNMTKEVIENRNVAVAIMGAAYILAIAIIIASAIH